MKYIWIKNLLWFNRSNISWFWICRFIKKIGIERRCIRLEKVKSFLDPFKEEKEEDISSIKKYTRQIHENFINYAARRGNNK